MFCGKCGAKNADDAAFCSGCGAKLNEGQVIQDSTPVVATSNDKNRKVGVIAVGVIAVVVIVLIVAIFGGRGYKATVDKYIDAQFDADAEAIVALIPDEVVACLLEDEGYEDDELDDFIKEQNEYLWEQQDEIDSYLGKDWKVSYEILNVEDVTGEELDVLQQDYDRYIGITVSAAKIVKVELTVTAEEVESDYATDVSVIKVGRSWYLEAQSVF